MESKLNFDVDDFGIEKITGFLQNQVQVSKIDGVVYTKKGKRNFTFLNNPNSTTTVLAVGGTGGGFYGPSYVYDKLAEVVVNLGSSMMRVDIPANVDQAVDYMYSSLSVLLSFKKTESLILIGWSMGGACIINLAKVMIERNSQLKVKWMISLAGQTHMAKPLKNLEIPISIIHGDADTCLNVSCGYTYFEWAKKGQLTILEGYVHWLSDETGNSEKFFEVFEKYLMEAIKSS